MEAVKAESEKERMRANLLRAVSHDLRTPLTTIYGSTSMLLENFDRIPAEDRQNLLRGIRDDAQWLVGMVENLLSVTRLDGGELRLNKTDTVLEELIDAVLVKFYKRCPEQTVTVTIPEGYSFMQVARLLEQKGVCSAEDFYNECQTYTPQSFTIPISEDRCFRMEGYLFPDTYRFYINDNPRNVLVKMLNNFRDKVGDVSDETLILASIIEREARSEKHMKLVSSVFHNRLNNRKEFLYLNADPTRDYVNKYITGNPLVSNQSKYAPLYNTCGKDIKCHKREDHRKNENKHTLLRICE